MIKPTIGRKVWYFVNSAEGLNGIHSNDLSTPLDANIVYVHSDTCVNIAGFDHNGTPFARTSVPINIENGGGASAWVEWMPYQVGQAKAAETSKQ